jgi:hypothetical protein
MKKFFNSHISRQETLFDHSLEDSALDVRMPFRDALSKALKQFNQSRWQVAAEVSRLSGHELSKFMLDRCTSNDFNYGLRAEDLPAILYVIQNLEPVKTLLAPLGCDILSPDENKIIHLAKLEQKNTRLQAEIARLKNELGIKDKEGRS